MARRPTSPDGLPEILPVFPLSGALLLPYAHRPLNIFEPRYVAMVDAALATDRLIALVQPTDTSEESPHGRAPLHDVGCIGRLTHFEDNGDERYFILLEGISRFRTVEEIEVDTPYRQFRVDTKPFPRDFDLAFGQDAVDRTRFLKMMRDYAEFASLDVNWEEIERTETAPLVNFCCMVSPYGAAEKQLLLEAPSLESRAETLIALAEMEMARGPGDNPAALN